MITKNNNKGYTLIELIVSIAVIAIISSIMFANYHQGGAGESLNAAAQNLVSEIRKIQGYALSHKEFNGTIQTTGGWGIMLSSNPSHHPEKFILFFDTDDSGKFNSSSELYLDGLIGQDVKVTDISFSGTSRPYFWAIHYPPNPKIKLNGANNPTNAFIDSEDSQEVEVTLTHSGGRTKVIKLNKYGLIDVD